MMLKFTGLYTSLLWQSDNHYNDKDEIFLSSRSVFVFLMVISTVCLVCNLFFFNQLGFFNQITFNLLNNIGCTIIYLCGQNKLHRMGSWFWIRTLWSLQEANNTSMVNNPTRMDMQNWWWSCWNCICKVESRQPSHTYYIWLSPALNCVVSAEHCMCTHAVA